MQDDFTFSESEFHKIDIFRPVGQRHITQRLRSSGIGIHKRVLSKKGRIGIFLSGPYFPRKPEFHRRPVKRIEFIRG
ncbi:hypothetical protein SDC9_185821 [bioreactor metagenome]|uniref:Uncharacterized protein n=1 Tax=bioreactor metagenome TaxID=1076179 RepID=A0A645HH62_9ZZZZ